MLDKKVSEIIEGGRSNVLELQAILLKKIQQNTINFFQNIKTKDYEKAQKNIDWGLDWDSKNTLKEIERAFENSFQDIKIIKILWDLKPDNIHHEIILDFFKIKEPLKSDQIIKEIFKKRFQKGYYQSLSEDVGLWLIEKINIFALDEKLVIKNMMSSLLLSSDLQNCEKLLDTICSKAPELIADSLSTVMKENNFNFMIKKYSFLLNKISNQVEKEKVMAEALEKGNLNIIKFLNKEGHPYPITKAPYAGLFGNTNYKEAMEYVVNTVEDITVGNQVILKTALHYNREKIIISILERYNNKQYEQIGKAMEKRIGNESLEVVKYFIFKNNLENNLNNSDNNKKNYNKI